MPRTWSTGQRLAARVLRRVGGDPPGVPDVVAVGAQVAGGDDVRAVGLDDPEPHGPGDPSARQGPGEVVGGSGQPEAEAPDEHPEGVGGAGDRAPGRQHLLATEGRSGQVTQAFVDLVDAEGGVREVRAQVVEQLGVGAGRGAGGHLPSLASPPPSSAPPGAAPTKGAGRAVTRAGRPAGCRCRPSRRRPAW